MATNPVDSLPNSDSVRAALRNCETVIVSDCTRRTDTTLEADILLPALAWGEKEGTVTNSERCISRQRAFLDTPGEAKPDWWIITQVARKLGYGNYFQYESPAAIFGEHAALSGYKNNDNERDFTISAFSQIAPEAYATLQPVQWPAPAGHKDFRMPLSNGQYFHTNGKAKLVAVNYFSPAYQTDEEFPFILNTGRVRDHWHTLTRTGKSPRLSQHTIEPLCEIHPEDAARMQLSKGMLVRLTSQWGNMIARCQYNTGQQKGSLFVPIHWNDQYSAKGRVSALVNPATDYLSGQPESKYTPVNIEPLQMQWQGFLLSRREIQNIPSAYWVKIRGEGYWQYELADENQPGNWQAWACTIMQYDPEKSDWLEYSDASIGCYRAADITGEKLNSCLFTASEHSQLPGRDWLQGLFKEQSLEKIQRACLLAGKAADTSQNCGPIVCSCFSVGRNTLQETIRNNNLMDVAAVGEHLQAGTNCGSCIPEIKQIIRG